MDKSNSGERSEDERLFQQAVAGVAPLAPDETVARKRRKAPLPKRDENAEVAAELDKLVRGDVAFDIGYSDEAVQGIAENVDRRLLRKLKRGDFAIGSHLDLHGLTRQEARQVVEQFLMQSQANGKRCVLIVHGRGLHSKDQIPVLKRQLALWLTRGGISRSVLAFCSAQPSDGGLGAVYVLLRKGR